MKRRFPTTCGICGSNIERILKTGTYHFSTIPAHEFCGEVAIAPPGSPYRAGERAVVDYIANGCLPMQEYISHHISLSELGAVLGKMASRSISYNKVIVDMAM